MDSPHSIEPTKFSTDRSEFEHFVDTQIAALIVDQRSKSVAELSRQRELEIAIDFCKKFLLDAATNNRRVEDDNDDDDDEQQRGRDRGGGAGIDGGQQNGDDEEGGTAAGSQDGTVVVVKQREEKQQANGEEEEAGAGGRVELGPIFQSFLTFSGGGVEWEKHRANVLAKLVELKLELEQYKELAQSPASESVVTDVNGHQFVLQSSTGRNPYCETCLGTIWRLAQQWKRCKICGYRTHAKCIGQVRRVCPSLALARMDFGLQFQLCPEKPLLDQNYQCAECFSPIGFDDHSEKFPRICDYTGLYYCRRCHWNDEMVIPARIVRNWDFEKRPVCRATKQLLTTVLKRPLINFERENPTLLKFVHKLDKMQKMRTNIMLMKCYFVSCKFARNMRILQHLNRFQHFVESDTMYTIDDLVQLAAGRLLADIEGIVRIFIAHITERCEICRGNAFFCELCAANQRIYPFSDNVAICKGCCAVYHRPCFDRAGKRCPRCLRRKARRKAVAEEEEEEHTEEEDEKRIE